MASCSKTLMPLQAADAALLLGWTPKKDAIPSRRFSELSDLDGPILLLASDAGKAMSGSTIAVDGAHLVSSL